LQDWLTKIFASIVSVKTAAISLLTCVGLVVSWQIGIRLIVNKGVPDDYAPYLLAAIIYSCSLIVVEALIKAGALKQTIARCVSLNGFKQLAKRSIPHLPKSQIELLNSLCENEQTYDIRKDDVIYLEQQKYIKRIHKVSRVSFVFEIDQTAKQLLITHLASERKTKLDDFVLKFTEDEKRFLGLFFSEEVSEGTRESGIKMEPHIFRAGEHMAQNKLLDHFSRTSKILNKESFRLMPDTAGHLKDAIFNNEPKRSELHLNSDFIIASYSSGGGAIGNR
jgi:hypothetical protein